MKQTAEPLALVHDAFGPDSCGFLAFFRKQDKAWRTELQRQCLTLDATKVQL